MEVEKRPRVIIIGAGFAGLTAAKKFRNRPVNVTLIDKNNHHLFQPLLYQVATAGLSPADIAVPVRFILRKYRNIDVIMDEVIGVDIDKRRVTLMDMELDYDYLLLAAGATHTYFGHEEWPDVAPGLKTVSEAIEIRRKILTAFETAEKCFHTPYREYITTFLVIGGGATGVELAGAISELSKVSMRSDFRRINPAESRVLLVEAGPRLLPGMSKKSSGRAYKRLEKLGVEIHLNSPVSEITEDYVIAGGNKYYTRTVMWSAGVKASSLGKTLGADIAGNGRVIVESDLSIPRHPEVFVAGDLAMVNDKSGNPVPGLAPAAIQEGRHAAENILRLIDGLETKKFKFFNKGCMATIGRSSAVAEAGFIKFSGFFAWIAWLLAHIIFLIGFRNRFIVLFQWMWAYLTFHSYSRLITYPWKPWRPGLPDRQLPSYPGCPCDKKEN